MDEQVRYAILITKKTSATRRYWNGEIDDGGEPGFCFNGAVPTYSKEEAERLACWLQYLPQRDVDIVPT
jgi:hypothetical protein